MDHVEQHVWDWMLQLERELRASADVLANHPQLTERMRYILLDWLMEVRLFSTFAYFYLLGYPSQ